MAQENSVSFKVFLQKEGSSEQCEVRRFGIDRDVVSNVSYLRQKLQLVFPSLQSSNFNIFWKGKFGNSIGWNLISVHSAWQLKAVPETEISI